MYVVPRTVVLGAYIRYPSPLSQYMRNISPGRPDGSSHDNSTSSPPTLTARTCKGAAGTDAFGASTISAGSGDASATTVSVTVGEGLQVAVGLAVGVGVLVGVGDGVNVAVFVYVGEGVLVGV
jgi:hypothetical protein